MNAGAGRSVGSRRGGAEYWTLGSVDGDERTGMGTGMGGFDRGNSKGRGEIRSWFYLGVSEYQVDDLSDLTRALRFFENPRVSARALVVVLPPAPHSARASRIARIARIALVAWRTRGRPRRW